MHDGPKMEWMSADEVGGMTASMESADTRVVMERDLRYRLRLLLDKAPSDSSAVFFLSRIGRGFKGFLKIRSRERQFVAGSTGGESAVVINDILQEIYRQIVEWRNHRPDST